MLCSITTPAGTAPVIAALGRCPTCLRWNGPRRVNSIGDTLLPGADAQGMCCGGPWRGLMRGARNACGHWRDWQGH